MEASLEEKVWGKKHNHEFSFGCSGVEALEGISMEMSSGKYREVRAEDRI